MNTWPHEVQRLVLDLVGPTAAPYEAPIIIILAVVACAFVLRYSAAASGAVMATFTRTVILMVVASAILLAAVIALRLYVIPRLHESPMVRWLPYVACVMLLFIAVLPLAAWLLASRFFESVLPIVLGVLAAVAISFVARYAMGALRTGDAELLKTRDRRDSLNQVMDGR